MTRNHLSSDVTSRASGIHADAEEVLSKLKVVLTSTSIDEGKEKDNFNGDSWMEELIQKDRVLQWMLWNELSDKLGENILSACLEDQYGKSSVLLDNLVEVVDLLKTSQCTNLYQRSNSLLSAVCQNLRVDLSEKISEDLTNLNYPLCVISENVSIGKLNFESESHLGQLRKRFFLAVKIGEHLPAGSEEPWSPNSLLLEPLKKRFKFHFCGKKKTNNIVRPEWFLQQVKIWMKRSLSFYESLVMGPARVHGDRFLVAKHHSQLCRGLFKLVRGKLSSDLLLVQDDDVLLGHFFDEVLFFAKDVHQLGFTKNASQEDLPTAVIESEDIFKRWLFLERKYAFEKIDASLQTDEGWQQSPSNDDIFQCTDTFVTLLQGLSARCKLINSDAKLKFLDLQCELIEDFRMRLVQMLRQETRLPVSDKYGLALNSASYLSNMLSGWCELPLFLHLSILVQSENNINKENGVFATVIDGLNFFIKESTKSLATSIGYEVKARSSLYKGVNWMNYQSLGDDSPCTEAMVMFQTIAAQLNAVTTKLKAELANTVVRHLIMEIGEFYIKDIIMENLFNPAGAKQLEVDVKQGLIPILFQFINSAVATETREEDKHRRIPRLEEALQLLVLQQANAILLRDSLMETANLDVNQRKEILLEFGIKTLSGSIAGQILSKRTDLF